MGRIRMMRALESGGSDGLALEKLESCLGCFSCEAVCPSKVEYGKLLYESLARVRKQRPVAPLTRMMLTLAEKQGVLKNLMRATWFAQWFGIRNLLARTSLNRANVLLGRVNYPRRLRNRTASQQRVALFTGCFSSVMEQNVQQAAIDVFNALDIEVIIPEAQGCCGALHRHSGELETAAKLARKNIAAFSVEQADAIVNTSSGCSAGLKAYSDWLEGEELPTPVIDVSHYLTTVLKHRLVAFERLPLKVALHTPCTLRQGEGQEEAVMELLHKIPGLELVPLSGQPRCCGAGGSQMLSQPEMADALRDDMVKEIGAMGADVVVSSNLGCAMHLRAGMKEAGADVPLLHPVQLIAQAVSKR